MWSRSVGRCWSKICSLLRQAKAQAGQRQPKQGRANPVDALARVRSAGNKSPGRDDQSDHDGHIEIENILPAKLLHDQRAIQRADHTASLCDRAYNPQRQSTPLRSVKIARDSHRHRHDCSTADRLDKSRGNQPDQTRRRCIDVYRVQKTQVRHLAKYRSQATEDGACAKDAQAEDKDTPPSVDVGDAPHQRHGNHET